MEKHRISLLFLASFIFSAIFAILAYTWVSKHTAVKDGDGSFKPLEVIYIKTR